MKKAFCFFFSVCIIACCCHAEFADISQMNHDELTEYLLSLSFRDMLVLCDKYDYAIEDDMIVELNKHIDGYRELPDISVFATYCLSRIVMEERGLMKYLTMVGMEETTPTFSPAPTPSPTQTPQPSPKHDDVQVPAGTYKIGDQIPAGHWTITCAPRNYCYVTVGSELKDNKKEIAYGSKGYYHIAMAGTESNISDRGYPSFVDLELTEGMYICIERSFVTFTPYDGNPGFTFN